MLHDFGFVHYVIRYVFSVHRCLLDLFDGSAKVTNDNSLQTKRYHIFKLSRIYEGRPYCGPTSDGVPAEYNSLTEAKCAADNFLIRNAVGWQVFDSKSGEMLYDTGIGKPHDGSDI